MSKILLSQNQFSDLLNLTNNVFFPLKNFVNKNEFELIVNESRYKKNFILFLYFLELINLLSKKLNMKKKFISITKKKL